MESTVFVEIGEKDPLLIRHNLGAVEEILDKEILVVLLGGEEVVVPFRGRVLIEGNDFPRYLMGSGLYGVCLDYPVYVSCEGEHVLWCSAYEYEKVAAILQK